MNTTLDRKIEQLKNSSKIKKFMVKLHNSIMEQASETHKKHNRIVEQKAKKARQAKKTGDAAEIEKARIELEQARAETAQARQKWCDVADTRDAVNEEGLRINRQLCLTRLKATRAVLAKAAENALTAVQKEPRKTNAKRQQG